MPYFFSAICLTSHRNTSPADFVLDQTPAPHTAGWKHTLIGSEWYQVRCCAGSETQCTHFLSDSQVTGGISQCYHSIRVGVNNTSSSSGWLLLLLRYIGGWGDLINYLVVFPSTSLTSSILNLFVVLYWLECFFVCFASCSKTMSWYFGQLYPTSYQPLLRSFSLCWTKRLPEETNSREEVTFKCAKKMEWFSLLYFKIGRWYQLVLLGIISFAVSWQLHNSLTAWSEVVAEDRKSSKHRLIGQSVHTCRRSTLKAETKVTTYKPQTWVHY